MEVISEVVCYLCNKQTIDFHSNFAKIRSNHSNTPIKEFIEKFLDGFESERNLDNETNAICIECFDQISVYDRLNIKATQQELMLRILLLETETKLKCDANVKIENEHSESVFVEEHQQLLDESSIKNEPTEIDCGSVSPPQATESLDLEKQTDQPPQQIRIKKVESLVRPVSIDMLRAPASAPVSGLVASGPTNRTNVQKIISVNINRILQMKQPKILNPTLPKPQVSLLNKTPGVDTHQMNSKQTAPLPKTKLLRSNMIKRTPPTKSILIKPSDLLPKRRAPKPPQSCPKCADGKLYQARPYEVIMSLI